MFEEFMGVPVHPLLVHAAVVFVPLQVLTGFAYALVPKLRARLDWLAVGLAVVGPVAALLAEQSGDELLEGLAAKKLPGRVLHALHEHGEYGESTFVLSLLLGLSTLLLAFVLSRRDWRMPAPLRNPASWLRGTPWVSMAAVGLVAVFGVLTGVYVILTGHSGAEAVWKGVL